MVGMFLIYAVGIVIIKYKFKLQINLNKLSVGIYLLIYTHQ